MWKQAHFTQTFDFLKKYVQSPVKTVDEFVQIVYPATELISCPYNNNTLVRYGNLRNTGKLLCGLEALPFNENCIVYSLGSDNEFLFEWSILSKTRCTVHTFDCTSSPPQQKYDRLHFHKICVGENSPLQHDIFPYLKENKAHPQSSERLFLTFDKILKMQNHKKVHVLKMDIEGAEYSVFTDLLKNISRSDLPYQISFESHWWNRDIYHAILHMSLFSQLWRNGYCLLQYELNEGDKSCIQWTFMRFFF
jgi:FkbM family methyltransferase